MTATDPQSSCDVQPVPEGVRVTCRRVPLEPGIVLSFDQWSQLASRLTAGDLPDFAVELPNSWVTKIAPPGQERNALYLWRDEVAGLAYEIATGRHAGLHPITEQSTVENLGRKPQSEPTGSTITTAPAPPSRIDHPATARGDPSHSRPAVAADPGAAVLDLTTAQIGLLTAMAATAHARIVDGVVRVATRTFSIQDLYTLRTAKLVRPTRDGRCLRDRKRFEITDHGTAQARAAARPARACPQPTPGPDPDDHTTRPPRLRRPASGHD